MKNKTLNSIIFIIITIGVLLFLDLYVFPSTANLYSSDGWSYSDNYTFLLIKYLFLILITIIIQIFNIKFFLKTSNLLYSIRYPLITINILNVIAIVCLCFFTYLFIIFIIFSLIPIFIIITITIIIRIYKYLNNIKSKKIMNNQEINESNILEIDLTKEEKPTKNKKNNIILAILIGLGIMALIYFSYILIFSYINSKSINNMKPILNEMNNVDVDNNMNNSQNTPIKDFDFDVMMNDLGLGDEKYFILEKDGRKYYYANQEFSLYIKSYDNTANKDTYNKYSFKDVLENNMLNFEDILNKAYNSAFYEDGGSTIYFYDDFNIVVCNNLSGNNHIFIGDKTVYVEYCE